MKYPNPSFQGKRFHVAMDHQEYLLRLVILVLQ